MRALRHARRPADPDALSDRQPLGRSSDFDHSANGFVPQHGRKLREPPVVVPDRKVGVTQSTVLDLHFHFLVPERPELDLLPNQTALSGRGDPCFDRCHRHSPTG